MLSIQTSGGLGAICFYLKVLAVFQFISCDFLCWSLFLCEFIWWSHSHPLTCVTLCDVLFTRLDPEIPAQFLSCRWLSVRFETRSETLDSRRDAHILPLKRSLFVVGLLIANVSSARAFTSSTKTPRLPPAALLWQLPQDEERTFCLFNKPPCTSSSSPSYCLHHLWPS